MRAPDSVVARLLRVYPEGSTSPVLAETEAGERYILKLAGAGPGIRALLTEILAAGIAVRLGLAVPPTRALYLRPNFPWQVGTDEFDDLVKRSAGWSLGIKFLPDALDLRADDLDLIPAPFLARLARVDRLLQNVDRTRKNPNILVDAAGAFWAIDHGACLFLDRAVAGRRPFSFDLPTGHFLSGVETEDVPPEESSQIDLEFLLRLVDEAPESWLEGLPATALAERLFAYVEAFRPVSGGALRESPSQR